MDLKKDNGFRESPRPKFTKNKIFVKCSSRHENLFQKIKFSKKAYDFQFFIDTFYHDFLPMFGVYPEIRININNLTYRPHPI